MALRVVTLTPDRLEEVRQRVADEFDPETACEAHPVDDEELRSTLAEAPNVVRVIQDDASGSWVVVGIAFTREGRIRRLYTRRKGAVEWGRVCAALCRRLKAEYGEAFGHWDSQSEQLKSLAIGTGNWAVLDPEKPWRVDWVGT